MVSHEQIVQFSNSIVKLYQPEQIILFGSQAYGTSGSESDVDLLVIMPFQGHHVYKAAEILEQTKPDFSVDLLVRTPDHIQQRLELNDYFLRDVLTKGRVLYASVNERMGYKS